MNEIENVTSTQAKPGIRLYLGISFILVSFLMVPTGLFVVKFFHPHSMKALILGFFWINGPLWKMIGIATMGKVSYSYIVSQLKLRLRYTVRSQPVGKVRYYIGLFMFILPFVPSYVMAYAPHLLPEYAEMRIYLNIFFDVVFISSLFVLGGDFWDKLRSLFDWKARASFPEGDDGLL